MDMNDAGNFLIETCDETVSRDLKQQLLLLNGRWRELFVKVKHVSCSFTISEFTTKTYFLLSQNPPEQQLLETSWGNDIQCNETFVGGA